MKSLVKVFQVSIMGVVVLHTIFLAQMQMEMILVTNGFVQQSEEM